MNKKRRFVAVGTMALAAVIILTSGFTLSYLIDKERADNIITIGNVKLELQEPSFPSEEPTVAAGSVVPKNPQVKNTGNRDEYVFLKVSVPKKSVTLLYEADDSQHKKGEIRIANAPAEVFRIKTDSGTAVSVTNTTDVDFSYRAGDASNDGWVYLRSDLDGADYDVFWFGYNKKLAVNATTNALFDKIQLKSFIDEELVTGTETVDELQVNVDAYGIQSEGLTLSFTPGEHLTDAQISEIFTVVNNRLSS